MKRLNPEISLGFLVASLFWIGVLGWQSSYSPTEKQKDECYETAKRTGYKNEECKTLWERTTSDPIALFNLVLAFSTVGLWIATISLYRAGEKQVRLAREEFESSQRAFVHLDGFNFELTTRGDLQDPPDLLEGEPEWHATQPDLVIRRFAVQPRWKNSGNTATKNLRIRVNWRAPPYAMLEPRCDYQGDPAPFFIGPKAVEASEVVEITGAMALINWSWHPVPPEPMIHIWGRADYEDVFGKPHFVEWCRRVRFSRIGGERKMRTGTIQWGSYNGTDEDTCA